MIDTNIRCIRGIDEAAVEALRMERLGWKVILAGPSDVVFIAGRESFYEPNEKDWFVVVSTKAELTEPPASATG